MPLCFPYVQQRRTDYKERASKVDIEHRIPVLNRERCRVAESSQTRGRDHEIQTAQRRDGAPDRGIHRAGLTHIALGDHGVAQLAS